MASTIASKDSNYDAFMKKFNWFTPERKSLMIGLTICSTLAAGVMINRYRSRQHDNIPMLAPDEYQPIRGHLSALIATRDLTNSVHEWMVKHAQKANWPSISCISRPPNKRLVLVIHPIYAKHIFETCFESAIKDDDLTQRFEELLGEGIFAVNGEKWKFHRKIASRMFSHRNLKNYMFDVSIENVKRLMEKLNAFDQKSVDFNDLLGRFTLDTFCEIAFGQTIGSVSSYPDCNTFGTAFDDMVERSSRRSTDILWKLKRSMNVGEERVFHENHQVIKEFVENILRKKNEYSSKMADESGKQSYDILSLYLKHDPNLSTKALYDISLNFIIAGRDTTRMLLSWWLYELCQSHNQRIVDQLYAEIDAFEREPTFSDFNHSFDYLEATLCEALRLHPPVPFLGRTCVQDIALPKIDGESSSYTIRQDDLILVCNYVMARNPNVWGADAAQFKPERWEKGLSTFDQYKFSAFNINPRMCLGKNFAIQEAKIFGYYFLKHFAFAMQPGHQVQIKGGAILNIKNGLPIIVKLRQK